MVERSITLPDTLDGFVDQQVSSGAYPDASEVVRAGLRLLKTRADRNAARLERLKAAIQVGLDDVARGDVEEVTDLDAYFRNLEAEVEAGFKVRRLVITATARRDAAAVLRESRTRFGPQASARYALLLKTAYRDLQTDPKRMQARRPVEALEIWTYAIRHSREHVPAAERVSSPRHLVAYAYDGAAVRILRVLHERMDMERRLKTVEGG